ncbi:MAG TPA: hypothetical protein VMK53_00860 [Gemmatimonadales bacterium]|nr:hypothetical protein [Gemmatimonadales bacterium]
MVTELGGAQISSLMETLPGIAQVLRSPVADAFVALIRQSARHPDFQVSEAEEVLRYAVRRNLMSPDESEKILAEVREGVQRRAERAADRADSRKPAVTKGGKVAKARPVARAKPAAKAKPAARPKAKAPVRKPKPAVKAKAKKAAPKKKAPARKR